MHMGNIYSQASNVVSWVGLEKTCEAKWPRGQVMAATELLHLMNNHVESNSKANERFYGLLDVEGLARVDALIDLCFRPYWSRLWVIQEFTLTPTVTVGIILSALVT